MATGGYATLQGQSARRTLNVCHAGSLTAAFTRVEEAFRQQHPDVTVVDTAGGSVDLGRRLAAGALPCDVYAPADYLVIDRLLKPARLADYSIVFASGRMVLAYVETDTRTSGVAAPGAFTPPASVPRVSDTWYEVLSKSGVRISGAHPFMDPGGYRAHMIFELAQAHYRRPGLYNTLLQHYQVNVADPAGPAPALGRDFSFQLTYEHTAAAAAKGNPAYRYATLPPEIDLSRGIAGRYDGSSVTMPGLGIPGSARAVTIPARQVEWGVTIPSKAANRDDATAFVAMLLGPAGRAALLNEGPAPLIPARASRDDRRRLPEPLRPLTSS